MSKTYCRLDEHFLLSLSISRKVAMNFYTSYSFFKPLFNTSDGIKPHSLAFVKYK